MNTRQIRTSNGGGVVVPIRGKMDVVSRGALAAALALALSGADLSVFGGAFASLPQEVPMASAGISGPPSFADVAARVAPTVVNVTVTHSADGLDAHPGREVPHFGGDTPFGDFFRRYFDERSALPKGSGTSKRAQGQGSGFIVDPDGYIVTNNHVIEGADAVQVTLNDGARYMAKIMGRDSRTDLALLKIDADEPLPHVTFGSSEEARVGDWVLAVGNPFGLGGSVSAGIISARGRDINSGPYDDYLQIDAPINRGNSGGPLFDAGGRVIGVNAAIVSPSGGNVGIGFAIPASTAAKAIDQLRAHGRIERGWLGVQIQMVTEEIAEGLGVDAGRGALVSAVIADGPAAAAGVREGDLILRVGEQTVDRFKELPRIIADTRPGTEVTLQVRRNGRIEPVAVSIGEMPDEDRVARAKEPAPAASQPRLGLFLAPLTDDARRDHGIRGEGGGVLVARVERGSPAAKAGIGPGDLITMVGQEPVSTPEEVVAKVREAVESDRSTVLLLVEQDGGKRFVAVRIAA